MRRIRLTDGEVLELTVNYSVTDADGASDQAAFTLTLTGTNDAPKLTGLQSSLPGGSEDNPTPSRRTSFWLASPMPTTG